jgi:hypothetical protein
MVSINAGMCYGHSENSHSLMVVALDRNKHIHTITA